MAKRMAVTAGEVKFLVDTVGPTTPASAVGLTDVRVVKNWAHGKSAPNPDQAEVLGILHRGVARVFDVHGKEGAVEFVHERELIDGRSITDVLSSTRRDFQTKLDLVTAAAEAYIQ